jgi:hypothetical protein
MDLDRLPAQLQALLIDRAESLAWDRGCCRRRSPLAGAALLQVLVLGCLAHPDPSLEDFAQTAGLLGHPVTAQAVAARFGPALADALADLVAAAVRRVVARRPATVALLEQFAAVQVQDSTTVTLPDALADSWRGGNTATGQGGQAAVKVQVRIDLRGGQVTGLRLEPGRANDHATPLQTADLRPGELHLRDLGYFDLDVLAAIAGAGAFFLSRLQDGTALFDEAGTRLDLADYLGGQPGDAVDVPVRLGVKHRLACRLVAVRLPAEVANRRRQALYAKARKKGYTPSAAKLALCAWNFYVTNVPAAALGVEGCWPWRGRAGRWSACSSSGSRTAGWRGCAAASRGGWSARCWPSWWRWCCSTPSWWPAAGSGPTAACGGRLRRCGGRRGSWRRGWASGGGCGGPCKPSPTAWRRRPASTSGGSIRVPFKCWRTPRGAATKGYP